MPYEIIIRSLVAGLIASLACGLGALPLLIKRFDLKNHTGVGYGFAGGLMFAASVYNLILPGLKLNEQEVTLAQALPVVGGILLGAAFLWLTDRLMPHEFAEGANWKKWGGRSAVLIFIAMSIHSIPEGVAVGVGYASEEVHGGRLGTYLAVAIAIHNIPEGLAVAIPMRAAGASIWSCFWAAFLTSLPQPIAAVPASVLSWLFNPIMSVLMGFAAGAMIFLVLLELIPDALATTHPARIAWAFSAGFCLMVLIQVVL